MITHSIILSNAHTHKIVVSKFEENLDKSSFESPAKYCLATSLGKLHDTVDALSAGESGNLLVITADTIVEIDGLVSVVM